MSPTTSNSNLTSSPIASTSKIALDGQDANEPMSLRDYTIATAPWNVIQGTAAMTVLGGLTGSTVGVIQAIPALPAGFMTAVNTGLFSFSFFTLREYAVIPFLTAQGLHPNPYLSTNNPTSSFTSTLGSSPRFNNLLPTAISGLASGTFFSYIMRKTTRGALRGGVTLGIGCTTLQVITNEVGVIRLKMLLRKEARERDSTNSEDSIGVTATNGSDGGGGRDIQDLYPASKVAHNPKQETFADRSDRLFGQAWTNLKDKMYRWSPVKRMSEEEYQDKLQKRLDGLQKQRDEVLRERELVETRLREIQEANEGVEQGTNGTPSLR